jgi:hypothetical protein
MKTRINLAAVSLALASVLTATTQAESSSATRRLLDNQLQWRTTPPLELPVLQDGSTPIAYKDPSPVYYKGGWYMVASQTRYVGDRTRYSMVYFSLDDLTRPETAKVVPLLQSEEYAAAPAFFYFTPHKKWYLVFGWTDQSKKYHGPAFSTFDDIEHPERLTAPRPMVEKTPDSLPKTKNPRWLDYTIIADGAKVYMFFTDDGGNFMYCTTSEEAFPFGWGDPVVALSESTSLIFEGSCTYKIKDGPFLTIVEAIAPGRGDRYYNSLVAEKLEGPWKFLSSADKPFAGLTNVAGSPVWSKHISHGEFLRDSYDEKMILDPAKAPLLYQGWDKQSRVPGVPLGRFNGYHETPWKLSILHPVE